MQIKYSLQNINDNIKLIEDFEMKLNTEANYGIELNELINRHGINEFLILNYFKNSDKDYWSLIVSSCQWIQVAESVLENVEDIRGDINIKSFNFFSYIFAIDMMCGSN